MFLEVFQKTKGDNRESMLKNKSKHTPSEAIRAIKGMTRKRFYEMLKNGEISYETEKWGKKERRIIDGSELARVFPDTFRTKETTETEKSDNLKQNETTEISIKNRLLEQEIKFLSEKLNDKESQIAEKADFIENLSGKLDKAQETIERQTYLIKDQQSVVETLKTTKEKSFKDHVLLWFLPLLGFVFAILLLISLKSFDLSLLTS